MMTAAPPLWAILDDVLLSMGAGLLLAMAWDAAAIAFGTGPLRCFVWDTADFAAAAFLCSGFAAGGSVSGAVRWYMAAAMGAGALCWRWCVSGALHHLLRVLLWVAVCPLRLTEDKLLRPAQKRLKHLLHRIWQRNAQNRKAQNTKIAKKQKNVLQKEHIVLYN